MFECQESGKSETFYHKQHTLGEFVNEVRRLFLPGVRLCVPFEEAAGSNEHGVKNRQKTFQPNEMCWVFSK